MPDDQLPSGLILLENFITTDEEQLMLRSIDWDSKDANSTAGKGMRAGFKFP